MKYTYNWVNFFSLIAGISGIFSIAVNLPVEHQHQSRYHNDIQQIAPIIFTSSTSLSIICAVCFMASSKTEDL